MQRQTAYPEWASDAVVNAAAREDHADEKLMKSYSDAGYFVRNLPAIEVLIDRDLSFAR